MVKKLLLIGTLAALVFPAASLGQFQDQKLNAVASVFAERPVTARCMEQDEHGSPYSEGAWGYVTIPVGKQTVENLDADICRAALAVNDPTVDPYMRAMGVMALVHESYHLRHWGLAGNEAKVQCQAIRHWRVGARMLGATEETIKALWPWALAAHYEETNITTFWDPGKRPYRDDDCQIPALEDS